MNILFVTQSGYLQLFYLLENNLKDHVKLDQTGYYISNRRNYSRFMSQKPKYWPDKRILLNEWDLLDGQKNQALDLESIYQYESLFDEPLWNSVLCDRRIFYGSKSVFTQNYEAPYQHEDYQRMILYFIQAIEKHIDQVKPDLIVSFICVTLGEHLYYLLSQTKNIPYLNLRNTKIENYLTASQDIYEPCDFVKKQYDQTVLADFSDDLVQFSKHYVQNFKKQRVSYEGQDFIHSKEKKIKIDVQAVMKIPKVYLNHFKDCQKHPEFYKDHQPNLFQKYCYDHLIKPWRFKSIFKMMKNRYYTLSDLDDKDFALYPMHLEPEIALFVYSRPFLNQIEVIRMFALSLPLNWKLVIKDHPKNPYYRSKRYYEKLLDIPNVMILDHHASTFDAIKRSKMILTLSGFVGFEALAQEKPVAGLGQSSYEFLPDSMYRKIDDPKRICYEIKDLIKNYQYDEEALIRYVASVADQSVRFNWFGEGKNIRNYYSDSLDDYMELDEKQSQFNDLSQYIMNKYKMTFQK